MSKPLPATKSLPLPFVPAAVPTARAKGKSKTVHHPNIPKYASSPRTHNLWLAIYLPQLALEAAQQLENAPAIASQEARGRFVVAAANANAKACGIALGMPVNAAWALCPTLQVALRETEKELDKLQTLANTLYRYSSVISVQPPNLLLVEIRASLRLFGSLDALLSRIKHATQVAGHAGQYGIAPSVAAARLLAFAGDQPAVQEQQALASCLGRLPIAVIALELPQLLPRLQQLGIRRLADLFRLPRAGLRRRFGAELIIWMERALGQRDEAPQKWTPPLHYRRERDLDEPLSVVAELFPIMQQLLTEFCAWLRARSLRCEGFVLHFYHQRAPATRLRLGLLQPSNQAAGMAKLLDLRLQREQLGAAVIGLRLDSLRLVPVQASNGAWWAGEQAADECWWQTIEALQARLGKQAMRSLACTQDARPELGWRTGRVNVSKSDKEQPPSNPRPAWLFPEPRRLNQQALQKLQIESRPERICSGWWDGQPVQRDYFRARSANRCWWMYRSAEGWFIHGAYELLLNHRCIVGE